MGLMHPVGPISMLGSMAVAARKVHWGKPIWVTEGGAELPVTNIAIGVALSLVDPGRFSADRAVGFQMPKSVSMITLAAVVLGVLTSEAAQAPVPETAPEEAGQELQGESAETETLLEETM